MKKNLNRIRKTIKTLNTNKIIIILLKDWKQMKQTKGNIV
jgi:hypothetical protein